MEQMMYLHMYSALHQVFVNVFCVYVTVGLGESN